MVIPEVLLTDGNGGVLSWTDQASGATGGGTDEWAIEHHNTVTTSYTIGTGKNVISAGPLTVNSGATVKPYLLDLTGLLFNYAITINGDGTITGVSVQGFT